MRLWSIHPKYLDSAGLTDCWREALLARKVLMGQTIEYKSHPQLVRFRDSPDPLEAINTYLYVIFDEAKHRGYNFDKTKSLFKFFIKLFDYSISFGDFWSVFGIFSILKFRFSPLNLQFQNEKSAQKQPQNSSEFFFNRL